MPVNPSSGKQGKIGKKKAQMKTIFRGEVGKKNEESKRKSRKNEENWKKRKNHHKKTVSYPAKLNAQNPANINARWHLPATQKNF